MIGRLHFQPLAQNSTATHPNPTEQANSLSAANSNAAATFDIWQPHFDRDFASVMDLLYLPVFGPHRVTSLMNGLIKETPEGRIRLTREGRFVADSVIVDFL